MLKHYRQHGRVSDTDAADLCGVSLRHYRDMESGKKPVTRYALNLLKVYGYGDMSAIGGHDWDGWRMVNGQLMDPTGDVWSPGDLMARHWDRQLLADLKRQLDEATAPGYQVALF